MVELWRKRPEQHFGPIVVKVRVVFSFCGQSNMPGLLISVSQGCSHCLPELSITAALWVIFKRQSRCTLWIVNPFSRIFLFFFSFFFFLFFFLSDAYICVWCKRTSPYQQIHYYFKAHAGSVYLKPTEKIATVTEYKENSLLVNTLLNELWSQATSASSTFCYLYVSIHLSAEELQESNESTGKPFIYNCFIQTGWINFLYC